MTCHMPGSARAEEGRGGTMGCGLGSQVGSPGMRLRLTCPLTCTHSTSHSGGSFREQEQHPDIAVLGSLLCCRDSKIPEPLAGHLWKEVRSNHTVTWLVAWTENIDNSIKHLMLNLSSKLKVRPVPGLLALCTRLGPRHPLGSAGGVGRRPVPSQA